MSIVYLASHPIKGSYVGVTSMGLAMRESSHWSAAQRNKNGGLHEALRESRRGDWDWTILHFVKGDEREAYRLEAEEIESRNPELNQRTGGRGGGSWINPTKEKFGRSNRGRKCLDHVKKILSETHRTRPRARKHDRGEMIRLSEKGWTKSAIAKHLGCDPALVSRVTTGIYKK